MGHEALVTLLLRNDLTVNENSVGVRAKRAQEHRPILHDLDLMTVDLPLPISLTGQAEVRAWVPYVLKRIRVVADIEHGSTREVISPEGCLDSARREVDLHAIVIPSSCQPNR
jgi:hypothetical protein